MYQNILAQAVEPTSPNRTPPIAASGFPAGQIPTAPSVNRKLARDRPSLVGKCLAIAARQLPSCWAETRLWSAAACCRFSASQLAGRQDLPIRPTETRASSLQESGSKLPHSKAPAAPLIRGAELSHRPPGRGLAPQFAPHVQPKLRHTLSLWEEGVERLSNRCIRIARTRISRSQTAMTTTVYARVWNGCGRGVHGPFGRM